ncbi:MAG: hypothetical protein J6V13_07495 [Paludibacteraceae bacterium]|nr:hypothetical protein [Paludibacteraceae bacterium]
MRKWNFKRRAKQHERQRKEFVSYAKIKQVMVLFESVGEKEDQVYHDIIRQLKEDGMQVKAFAYMEKSKNTMYHHDDITILEKKQIGCMHVPEEQIIQQLKNTVCDVLFDFTMHTVLPLQYVMLYVDAKCRVGVKCDKLLKPDFMIEWEENSHKERSLNNDEVKFLFNQMLFYLKTIRTTL